MCYNIIKEGENKTFQINLESAPDREVRKEEKNMATYEDIKCLPLVNDVDEKKVSEIKESILANGWQGAPILYTNLGLVTGSHRLAALQEIEEDDDVLDDDVLFEDIAEDVTDIINDYCEKNDMTWEDLDFSYLREIFAGTWVEEYKDEIREW